MKNKVFQIALLIILFLFPSAWGAERPDPKIWEPLNNSFYYNKKVIARSPGLLLVWTYRIIPADVREKTMEETRKSDPEKSAKYKDYHHAAILWEMDCARKLMRTEEFIDFDAGGRIIDRNRHSSSEWTPVVPKTGGDALYQKACLPPQEPGKKKKRR